MKAELNKSGKKYIILSLILIFIQYILLFVSAGNIKIFRFWLYVIVQTVYIIFSLLIMYHKTPGLLNSRGEKKDNTEEWDVKLVKLINIQIIFVLPVIMGIDNRMNWSYLSTMFIITGFILYILSNIFVLTSMIVNRHFETNVRIQEDRYHKIIKAWPYSFIRHPGYLGTILWLIGVPMILGSLIGLLYSSLIITIIIIRSNKEDDYLSMNMNDYQKYKKEVKYRLFPLIW